MPKRSEGAPKGPGLRRAIKWEVLATKREIEADIPSLRLTGGLRLARCRAGRLRLTPPSRREGRGEGKTPSSGPQARPRKREIWGGDPGGLAPRGRRRQPPPVAHGDCGPGGPAIPHARRKNASERRRQRRRPAWSLPLLRSSQGSGQSGRRAWRRLCAASRSGCASVQAQRSVAVRERICALSPQNLARSRPRPNYLIQGQYSVIWTNIWPLFRVATNGVFITPDG